MAERFTRTTMVETEIVFLPKGRLQPQHKKLPLLALPTLQICAPVDDTVSSHLDCLLHIAHRDVSSHIWYDLIPTTNICRIKAPFALGPDCSLFNVLIGRHNHRNISQ